MTYISLLFKVASVVIINVDLLSTQIKVTESSFFWWPMFSQNMLIWTINTIFDTKKYHFWPRKCGLGTEMRSKFRMEVATCFALGLFDFSDMWTGFC